LFTSRFSSGLILLEYIKGLKRLLCQYLHLALYRCETNFDKIGQIGLKLAPGEKCGLAAFIMTCKLGLAVGNGDSRMKNLGGHCEAKEKSRGTNINVSTAW